MPSTLTLDRRRPGALVAAIAPPLLACLSGVAGAQAPEPSRTYLKLIDPLDRPDDGYCVDVLGSGNAIRFDMPLTAHNCKPGYYADEGVARGEGNTLVFPAYGACVTAMGVNRTALPGASLMLKPCLERSAFLEGEAMQRFEISDDGEVSLVGSGLCLQVGDVSAPTFDPSHRWRTLALARCESADTDRSRWAFEARGRGS